MGVLKDTSLKTLLTKLKDKFAPLVGPVYSVNGVLPNPLTGDTTINTVPLADNLTSDEAQYSSEEYLIRTSGGDASISDGEAYLTKMLGNSVHDGYVAEVLTMDVNAAPRSSGTEITATYNRETLIGMLQTSQTITFSCVDSTPTWSPADPATYGITVSGEPIDGDEIQIVYVKEERGTITNAAPSMFKSTGWNLFNKSVDYAYVSKYSDTYGFRIDGDYTALEFATSASATSWTPIIPSNGLFTVPSNGYVKVTGGNIANTAIYNTWSDWVTGYQSEFERYSEESVDVSSIVSTYFPFGLCKIGSVRDEIDLNAKIAYSRIGRIMYSDANMELVETNGYAHEVDNYYIYYVKPDTAEPPTGIDAMAVIENLSIDGTYDVNQHGNEFITGSSVPVLVETMYVNDLKNKLERDVLTISQQSLTNNQKTQVRNNIGAIDQSAFNGLVKTIGYNFSYTISANSSKNISQANLNINAVSGYTFVAIRGYSTGSAYVYPTKIIPNTSTAITLKNTSSNSVTAVFYLYTIWIKTSTISS